MLPFVENSGELISKTQWKGVTLEFYEKPESIGPIIYVHFLITVVDTSGVTLVNVTSESSKSGMAKMLGELELEIPDMLDHLEDSKFIVCYQVGSNSHQNYGSDQSYSDPLIFYNRVLDLLPKMLSIDRIKSSLVDRVTVRSAEDEVSAKLNDPSVENVPNKHPPTTNRLSSLFFMGMFVFLSAGIVFSWFGSESEVTWEEFQILAGENYKQCLIGYSEETQFTVDVGSFDRICRGETKLYLSVYKNHITLAEDAIWELAFRECAGLDPIFGFVESLSDAVLASCGEKADLKLLR